MQKIPSNLQKKKHKDDGEGGSHKQKSDPSEDLEASVTPFGFVISLQA